MDDLLRFFLCGLLCIEWKSSDATMIVCGCESFYSHFVEVLNVSINRRFAVIMGDDFAVIMGDDFAVIMGDDFARKILLLVLWLLSSDLCDMYCFHLF